MTICSSSLQALDAAKSWTPIINPSFINTFEHKPFQWQKHKCKSLKMNGLIPRKYQCYSWCQMLLTVLDTSIGIIANSQRRAMLKYRWFSTVEVENFHWAYLIVGSWRHIASKHLGSIGSGNGLSPVSYNGNVCVSFCQHTKLFVDLSGQLPIRCLLRPKWPDWSEEDTLTTVK